jgi:DNA repair protein RecN (Recombination protein N)
MLVELAVKDLGVIAEMRLTLGEGMTALTGETGAGKTMVVEAIGLLLGGRPDPERVRPGADELVVEGLFDHDGVETVLRRVVPRTGRSRSYVNGDLAPAAQLEELGRELVEVHGQHAAQWLVRGQHQRAVLDRHGGIDTAPLDVARATERSVRDELAGLGGDDRARAREIDLLRYQLEELEGAGLDDPDEDVALQREEDLLADAVTHREVAAEMLDLLDAESGATERLAQAIAALERRDAFSPIVAGLRSVGAELDEVVHELRELGEGLEDDPERLATVQARRALLAELRRKYGETLAEVIAERDRIGARLAELDSHAERAQALGARLTEAEREREAEELRIATARAAAAPELAAAIEEQAQRVALAGATFGVDVDGTAGEQVEIRFAANVGMEPRALAKAASGGELSRAMLALHLVLSSGPPTMVFDEVDAGVGGATAVEVGRALARVARDRQVVVVTHLPQVAAFADRQLRVEKREDGRMTTTSVSALDDDDRVIELSRMLSGSPDSAAAQAHAGELLAAAAEERAG